MNTIKDFKNAPVGATANRGDGVRALKMDDSERGWIIPRGEYLSDEELELRGFTLDPLDPATPTTAREALELAWELAHPVTLGQVIPEGTRYLEIYNSEVREYSAPFDTKIIPERVSVMRTLEPLPDPEPDWLDAPAVLATMDGGSYQEVWLPMAGGHWKCTCCHQVRHWPDLVDVTPLYPKEEEGEWVSL